MTRRWASALVALTLILSGLAARAQDGKPSLYVFLHTDSKSATLEKDLQEKLPSMQVTVFGRFRDFEEALAQRRPDAILSRSALLTRQSVTPALQGFLGENDWEPYVLLSAGAALEGSLSGKMIGVVDMLGRVGTQEFVTKLLKTPDVNLKRVTKTEDLLPLLQFSAADAVLVASAGVKALTERSRLPLHVRNLPDAKVGLPAVGVLNPKLRDMVVKGIQSLDGETNKTIGLDRWRVPK